MRRTKKGKKFIENLSKHKKFWKVYSTIGVIVGILVLVFITGFITYNGFQILTEETKQGAGLVLPSSSSEPVVKSGYILLPWWLWVIALITIMIPHEFSHGVIAKANKIKIKSLGWLLLLFLPGAFVEPDEKQLKKSKTMTRLRVYAAGSFANFITALLCLGIFTLMFSSFFVPSGVSYQALMNNTDAYTQGLNGTIIGLDNQTIKTVEDYRIYMEDIQPNQTVIVQTTQGNYSIQTTAYDDRAIIGVWNIQDEMDLKQDLQANSSIFLLLLNTFNWLFVLNLSVGMINLLPMKPLDGGAMFETILERKTKNSTKIANRFSIVMFLILLFNVLGPAIMNMI